MGNQQRNSRLFGWYHHFGQTFLKRSPFLLAEPFVRTISWLLRPPEAPPMKRSFFLVPVLIALAGCASTGNSRPANPPPPNAKPFGTKYTGTSPAGLVLVANGSGDSGRLSSNLTQVAANAEGPLEVESFIWSHGWGRSLTDHLDHDNQVSQGRRLASQVTDYAANHPDHHIHLVGHSTGCAVVLIAAENLSPGAIDGITLLAPSVSANHDLRPALRSTRGRVEVYCSAEDRWILGFGMKILGTSDLNYSDAAGLYGFKPVDTSPDDAALYQKLHQHPWDSTVAWTGNDGSHYGCIQPGFLKAYVLPELVR